MCDNELYNVLGVDPNCDEQEIKRAYRKMAMKFHPDKNPSSEAEQKFKEINFANEILSNPEKRQQYDRYGLDAFKNDGSGGMDVHDLFSQYFGGGGFGGRRQQRGPKKTKNIEHVIRVSLAELYSGAEKKMKVAKNVLCLSCDATGSTDKKKYDCQVCHGTGTHEILRNFGMGIMRQMIQCDHCGGRGWNIPKNKVCQTCRGQKTTRTTKIVTVEIEKGSKHNKQIRFAGEADEEPGYQTGDLIFILQEMKHETFQRDGENLIIQKTISLANALTGVSFELQHLDGKKYLIESPQGMVIQPDSVLELADLGMPVYNYPFEFGSLYVKFSLEFPQTLNNDQIQQLMNILPGRMSADLSETDTIQKVLLQQVDQHKQQRTHNRNDRAEYSSDDESSHRGGGVQCAQQ